MPQHSPMDEQTLPVLLNWLQAPEESRRIRGAAALGRLGQAAKDAVPALVQTLHDANSHVRRMAAVVLGDMGVTASGAVPALLQTLNDPDVGVRRRAALALGDMGAVLALPALQEMAAQDASESVRRGAQMALQLIQGTTAPARAA